MGGSIYAGISDGIYEVNGTFGGTAGLELVSQVTGAPITMWNWINVISLACMLLASLILIFQLGPKFPWTRRAFDSRTMQRIRGTEVHSVRGTLYTVMRVFFSYFMTPVAAWTSYQLTYAPFLPVHHIVISVLVLVLMPVAFWWSLRQTTARQLGYFLVDAPFTQDDAAEFLAPRTNLPLPSLYSCTFAVAPLEGYRCLAFCSCLRFASVRLCNLSLPFSFDELRSWTRELV
jgi:hypothetical protein